MKMGDRIRQRREYMEITASELADRVGESKQTIYKYENGIVENDLRKTFQPCGELPHPTFLWRAGCPLRAPDAGKGEKRNAPQGLMK